MENENHFSPAFSSYYHEVVRPLAVICSEGYHVICKSEKGEIIDENDPEFIYLKSLTDAHAPYFIGCMIGDIDKHLIKGIRLTVINSISQVHGCLTSEDYWRNVWKNETGSKEAKNLKALGEAMKELLTKMN